LTTSLQVANIPSKASAVATNGPARTSIFEHARAGEASETVRLFHASLQADFADTTYSMMLPAGRSFTTFVPILSSTALEPEERFILQITYRYPAVGASQPGELAGKETVTVVITGDSPATIAVSPASRISMTEGTATPLFTTLATLTSSDGQTFFEIVEGDEDNPFRISQNKITTQSYVPASNFRLLLARHDPDCYTIICTHTLFIQLKLHIPFPSLLTTTPSPHRHTHAHTHISAAILNHMCIHARRYDRGIADDIALIFFIFVHILQSIVTIAPSQVC